MKRLFLIFLAVAILLFQGCKTENQNNIDSKTIAKTNDNIDNNTAKLYYTYIKEVNDLTINEMLLKYKVNLSDEVDKSLVIMGDVYYDLYREKNDVDEYKIVDNAHHVGLSNTSVGLDYRDILFPENIKIKQLIKQKLRKEYIENSITEDDILYKVEYMVGIGIKPNEEEMKSKNMSEADWYRDTAIRYLLIENSNEIIDRDYNNLFEIHSYKLLHQIFGEDLNGIYGHETLEKFLNTSNLKDIDKIVKEKIEEFISG